jgi:hypothetical protein
MIEDLVSRRRGVITLIHSAPAGVSSSESDAVIVIMEDESWQNEADRRKGQNW